MKQLLSHNLPTHCDAVEETWDPSCTDGYLMGVYRIDMYLWTYTLYLMYVDEYLVYLLRDWNVSASYSIRCRTLPTSYLSLTDVPLDLGPEPV